MSQVSSCLYKNVVNETKPSQRNNCLVPVDMKNTIGSLGKKCKLIIKIILFVVNNNSQKLVLRKAKTFPRDLERICCYNKWQKGMKM